MTRRRVVALVVDANVAACCSEQHVGSGNVQIDKSIEVLTVLRDDKRFCIAFSAPLQNEWFRHPAPWSRKWLYTMTASGRVRAIDPPNIDHLRRSISALQAKNKREAADKDAHLIELALAADRRILSHDNESRRIFAEFVGLVAKMDRIQWAAPTEERCVDWLSRGAPEEDCFKLRRLEDRTDYGRSS